LFFRWKLPGDHPDRTPPPDDDPATSVSKQLERIKWFCWHGNAYRALQIIEDLAVDLDIDGPSVSQTKLLKAVREFGGYLAANTGRIPNHGDAAAPGRPSLLRSSSPRSGPVEIRVKSAMS
jgi:hypothetical protein